MAVAPQAAGRGPRLLPQPHPGASRSAAPSVLARDRPPCRGPPAPARRVRWGHRPGCENPRMTAPDSDRGTGLRPPKWRIGPQRALFDNPVGSISMEEVTGAVLRLSEPDRSQTVASLADDVLGELAIKRTPRAREIVMEAIRLARRSHAR